VSTLRFARVATVRFTQNLRRHVECPAEEVDAATARSALDAYFVRHPQVRGYILDEQGTLRTHVNVFVDGTQVVDRTRMDDAVHATSEVYVMQALSGG
jgi:molybdopterin synthase sulfur carrier subunit